MNSDDQPSDPFADFINTSLDMQGIDGLDQAAIAEQLRGILRGLPSNVTAELWNERLDDLQAAICVCLDLDAVTGAFEEKLEPTSFSRDDLEILIMLSVTFAFISYNQLHPAYNVDEPRSRDTALMVRRLRDTLQVTLGWVKRAARDGDPIAVKLVEEVYALLNASKYLGEE